LSTTLRARHQLGKEDMQQGGDLRGDTPRRYGRKGEGLQLGNVLAGGGSGAGGAEDRAPGRGARKKDRKDRYLNAT